MPVVTEYFSIDMRGDTEIENITEKINSVVKHSALDSGILVLFIKHTTASIMLFEDEPGLRQDTKDIWNKLIPANPNWHHNIYNSGEINGHSHLRGQIQGQSLTIPFIKKTLTLGNWQQIVVVDFDTCARKREIVIQMIGE